MSLRGRLLAGLIGLTAIFLVVMGVVSTVVLGHLEQSHFNSDLKLAARQPGRPGHPGHGRLRRRLPLAAYRRLRRADGELGRRREMRGVLGAFSGQSAAPAGALAALPGPARDQPFDLTPSAEPAGAAGGLAHGRGHGGRARRQHHRARPASTSSSSAVP